MYQFYIPDRFSETEDYSNLILDGYIDLSDLSDLVKYSPKVLTVQCVDGKADVDWESIYKLELEAFAYLDFDKRFDLDFSHMRSLKNVWYKGYGEISLPDSIEVLAFGKYCEPRIGNFKNLSKLQNLSIGWGGKLEAGQFEAITGFHKLESLALTGCHQLESIEFLRGLDNLTGLGVHNCNRLENIEAIDSLVNLTFLSVGKLKTNLSPSVFSNCRSLEVINLAPGARFDNSDNGFLFDLPQLKICQFAHSRSYKHSEQEIRSYLFKKFGKNITFPEYFESVNVDYTSPWEEERPLIALEFGL